MKTLSPELQFYSEQIESGYLMAAAPNQQVKVKVFTNTVGQALPTSMAAAVLDVRLFAKTIVMCNEEREQMKRMPMGLPKRIKTTQNANLSMAGGSNVVQTIDLDHFSLYTSHLLITVPSGKFTKVDSLELLLNSSSFSGALPISLLKIMGASMNLYTNNFTAYQTDIDGFDTIVFPLASRAYSGSSVPLNRFDNIRLRVKYNGAASDNINITCVGETTALYKGGASSLAMY